MSLFLRNLFFTILQPGIVAVLIPWWLSGRQADEILPPAFLWFHILGLAIFTAGTVLMLICIVNFALHGKGTLSPADPTKKLVIAGPYKFSRNPMYVGVMMMLIGESIYFQSSKLGVYALIIFIAFYTFIVFFEEARLQNDFGNEYTEYRKRVRRWI